MKAIFLFFVLCVVITGCVTVQAPMVVMDEGSAVLYDADHMSLLVATSLEKGQCQNANAFGALLYMHFALKDHEDVEQLVALYHEALKRQSEHGIKRDPTIGMFFERTIRQAERTKDSFVDFVYAVKKECVGFNNPSCIGGCYVTRRPLKIP